MEEEKQEKNKEMEVALEIWETVKESVQEVEICATDLFEMFKSQVDLNDPSKAVLFEEDALFVEGKNLLFSLKFTEIFYKPLLNLLKKQRRSSGAILKAKEAEALSGVLVLLNGELALSLNTRRDLMRSGIISNLERELQFIQAVCLKFKRSSNVWFYRFEVIRGLLEGSNWDLNWLAKDNSSLSEIEARVPRSTYIWVYKTRRLNFLEERNSKETEEFVRGEIVDHQKKAEKNITEFNILAYLVACHKWLKSKGTLSKEEAKKHMDWVAEMNEWYNRNGNKENVLGKYSEMFEKEFL